MELSCVNVLNSEVKHRLGDEYYALLEHVEPTGLGLDVGLEAGLALFGFEVVAGLDEVDAGGCVEEVDEDLELGSCIFLLKFREVGGLLEELRIDLGLDVDGDFLLDLDDDVAVDGLALVDGAVLVELEDDGDLGLVGHGEDEALGDVAVLDVVVEGDPVKPDALLVKVHRVLAPRHCQVHVQHRRDRLPRKLPYLGPLDDVPVDLLDGPLPLPLALLLHPLPLLLPALLHVQPDLAQAVVVAELVGRRLDDNVLLVDGGVGDGGVVEGEEGVVVP